MKPLEGHSKQGFIIASTTFTFIVLQSIVAKRMLAPAISTPLTKILKNKIEEYNNIKQNV